MYGQMYAKIAEYNKNKKHYKRFKENHLKNGEEQRFTILIHPPTQSYGEILQPFLENMGYRVEVLPVQTEIEQKIGKTYVNRGQCFPVQYLVGSLLWYIFRLKEQGLTNRQIIESYAYFTISSSGGACRFQMYEEEYRKALKTIGLKDFIIEIFTVSKKKITREDEYKFPKNFGKTLAIGLILGDILNNLQYKIRPYEINKGETDKVFFEVRQSIKENCTNLRSLFRYLKKARKLIETIPVDFSQLKPRIHIIGEIFCSITEGHITADMFRWLESIGAEVSTSTFSHYYLYNIWRSEHMIKLNFKSMKGKTPVTYYSYFKKRLKIKMFTMIIRYIYYKFSKLMGNHSLPLTKLKELLKASEGLYHKEIFGGEGCMEVSKHIVYIKKKYADMLISLKPFTCMPSVASDAIQTKVENMLQDSIFIPVEVNGDGVINMRSRIQMKMFEAKEKIRSKLTSMCNLFDISENELKERFSGLNISIKDARIENRLHASTYLNLVEKYSHRIKK